MSLSKKFLALVKDLVESVPSCHCDEAYLSRNLTDPFCPRCNYYDEGEITQLQEMLAAEIENSKNQSF